MAVEYKDSVKDYTTTTGTGTVTLTGDATNGCKTFAQAHTDGATVHYRINSADQSQWEVGEGVFTLSGLTQTRVTVFASSNSGNLVNFSAGTKSVISTFVAKDADASEIKNQSFTNQTSVTVTHNYGSYPRVRVIDNNGAEFIPFKVIHNSINDFTMTFKKLRSGTIIY